MDTNEKEDNVQLSSEIGGDKLTIPDVMNDPVDTTYSEAIKFLHKIHPSHQDEIIEWFDRLKGAHYDSIQNIHKNPEHITKTMRQMKAIEEAENRPDQVYLLDWLYD